MRKVAAFAGLVVAMSMEGAAFHSVVPDVSPNAQALLNYMEYLKNRGLMTGQHNYVGSNTETERVKRIAGEYPAVWGSDFSYGSNVIANRQKMIDNVIAWHSKGGIVTLMWHMVVPNQAESAGWNAVKTSLSTSQWDELVKPGTAMHTSYIKRIDLAAPYLKQLQSRGVPVLWRPFHEINMGGFWWSKGKNVAQAWKIMFDRYTNYHKLNNLIWVYNFNRRSLYPNTSPWYPGAEYVDMITVDDYSGNANLPADQDYQDMKSLAPGKLYGLGEVPKMPDPTFVKNNRPGVVYWLSWTSTDRYMNTDSWVKTVFGNPFSVNLADVLKARNTTMSSPSRTTAKEFYAGEMTGASAELNCRIFFNILGKRCSTPTMARTESTFLLVNKADGNQVLLCHAGR